jgi:hypothetical protein
LDSLVRIETYQWVTSDFLRNFFHARSWSLGGVERPLAGGSLCHHAVFPNASL